jgi:hypothetical protein
VFGRVRGSMQCFIREQPDQVDDTAKGQGCPPRPTPVIKTTVGALSVMVGRKSLKISLNIVSSRNGMGESENTGCLISIEAADPSVFYMHRCRSCTASNMTTAIVFVTGLFSSSLPPCCISRCAVVLSSRYSLTNTNFR